MKGIQIDGGHKGPLIWFMKVTPGTEVSAGCLGFIKCQQRTMNDFQQNVLIYTYWQDCNNSGPHRVPLITHNMKP